MPKTDIEILEFIYNQPNHAASPVDLRSFIGENANRRISDLVHAKKIRSTASWLDDTPEMYVLDVEGEKLLAAHRQQIDQARQHEADRKAEADRKESSDRLKALIDKKKDYRHDFKVAAFTVFLTLIIEHHAYFLDLLKKALESVGLP